LALIFAGIAELEAKVARLRRLCVKLLKMDRLKRNLGSMKVIKMVFTRVTAISRGGGIGILGTESFNGVAQ
jgi:hypothetical protein